MQDLENILKNKNVHYDYVKNFLNTEDENILFKILHNIIKFDDDSKKKICETIIVNTDNKSLIETACREISTFIPFDYDYYKKILKITISKKIEGRWISEFINNILENSIIVLQEVFQDFSLDKPTDIDYDLSILQEFLHEYDKYFTNINKITISKEQALLICKRLNYILSIELKAILKLYFQFFTIFKFNQEDLDVFLKKFSFNYPSICKQFIKNEDMNTSLFVDYLKKKNSIYDSDNSLKDSLSIFKPNFQRLSEYQRYQIIQSNEINEQSRGMSIFFDFCKPSTILYSNRYGMIAKHKNVEEVFIGDMHEFSYSYPLPLEYIIDPINYMDKVNEICLLGKEDE